MIKLKINGIPVEVEAGTTVLEAARKMEVHIPTLCYLSTLTPYGGCRICLVEVEGMPRPMTSCTLSCAEGMTVRTDTEELKKLRRFSLQLILSEHPYSCLICTKKEECAKFMDCIQKEPVTFGCKYCTKNGSCELQTLVDELEIKDVPFPFHYRGLEVERYDPFFERDYNLCVLCGRCVRTCVEARGAATIDFHHRGPRTLVGTAFNRPHLDARCQFCGACVDACPTGAMAERYSKYEGKSEQTVASSCPLCSLGCPVNLNVKNGRLINVTPAGEPVCARGRFGITPIVNHGTRITSPLIRKDGRIVEVDWPEALDHAAGRLNEFRQKVGIIFSPDLNLEAIDAAIDLGSKLGAKCVGSSVIPGVGAGPLKWPITPEALIAVGIDLVTDFSVLMLRLRAATRKVFPVIVIDPLRTRAAESATLWLRPKPGKEAELLNHILGTGPARNTTGVPTAEIDRARELLAGRKADILADPAFARFNARSDDDCARILALPGEINKSRVSRLGVVDYQEALNDAGLDCLYLIGETPKLDRQYRFVMIQDCFRPDFEFDLFLPCSTLAETDGIFEDFAGGVRRLHRAVEPAERSQPDLWILNELGRRITTTAAAAKTDALLPKPEPAKKLKTSKTFPFYLMVRDNFYRYRSRLLSSLMKGFQRYRNDERLWINPQDARALKLTDAAEATVRGKGIEVKINIFVTDRVPQGVLMAYADPARGLYRDAVVRIGE
jgi:NADH dehydrogenase/NADH:ubiquinone oxidoreductase subunit G